MKKTKIGYHVQVTVPATNFFSSIQKIKMHCKNIGELKQRLYMYKGRIEILGYWNGQEMKSIDKKIKQQLKEDELL